MTLDKFEGADRDITAFVTSLRRLWWKSNGHHAREGADVLVSYLSEHDDAKETDRS